MRALLTSFDVVHINVVLGGFVGESTQGRTFVGPRVYNSAHSCRPALYHPSPKVCLGTCGPTHSITATAIRISSRSSSAAFITRIRHRRAITEATKQAKDLDRGKMQPCQHIRPGRRTPSRPPFHHDARGATLPPAYWTLSPD